MSLPDRLGALLGGVWRRAPSHPEAYPERRVAPAGVLLFDRLPPDRLARADQRRRSLELLKREQAQRVSHEYGDSVLASPARHLTLQSADAHRVRRESQVSLGLATACWEPQEIGDCALLVRPLGVMEIRQRWQVEEDESQLEGVPASVGRDVDRV